jgi:choline dehydrogenase-like flavoprotein
LVHAPHNASPIKDSSVFVDTLDLDDQSTIECDIAIIGAGMAGICLAREFAGSGLSVSLLESGGEKPDSQTDAFSAGSTTIFGPDGAEKSVDDYLQESRERYFGGTGNAWGGKCAYFDTHDFAERSWIPNSGWPFDAQEIKPFYDRACHLLRIPTLTGLQSSVSGDVEHLNAQRNFATSLRCFSGVTGKPMSDAFYDYKYGLKDVGDLTVYLHANVACLHLDKALGRITAAEVRCLNNKQHTVKARYFVLASGGIENVRILMNSEGNSAGGIGNRHDLLGRFFNGHGMFRYLGGFGQAPSQVSLLNDDLNLSIYTDKNPAKTQGVFSLTYKAQWRERVAQFAATLTPNCDGDSDDYGIDNHSDDGQSNKLGAFFMIEQYPNRESRIRLSNDVDSLGIPAISLEWRFSSDDMKTLKKGIELFSRDLGKSGSAELLNGKIGIGIAEMIESSRHHMGGTRMCVSDQYGVVDQDSRVHDVENLFVAGSSIFPTGSIANPTLTILALSIRLADHVKKLCSPTI